MQLEINDQNETSYLYNNVGHIPRIGEKICIYKDDSSGDIEVEGIVNRIEWSFPKKAKKVGDYTVTVWLL
jgi:hypothetical protein